MDEFIDELLTKERVCDIALPHIKTRAMLEDADELEARDSALGSEIESEGEEGEEAEEREVGEEREEGGEKAKGGEREEGEEKAKGEEEGATMETGDD